VALLRGDDLLFAQVRASEAADALGAPLSSIGEGIGPIRHVSLVDAELALRLEFSADILRYDDVAV
jgi:hypothetical protein